MQLPEDLIKKLEEFREQGLFEQVLNAQDELPQLSDGFMTVLSVLSSDICNKELKWIPEKLTIRETSELLNVLLYHIQLGRVIQHLLEK